MKNNLKVEIRTLPINIKGEKFVRFSGLWDTNRQPRQHFGGDIDCILRDDLISADNDHFTIEVELLEVNETHATIMLPYHPINAPKIVKVNRNLIDMDLL